MNPGFRRDERELCFDFRRKSAQGRTGLVFLVRTDFKRLQAFRACAE